MAINIQFYSKLDINETGKITWSDFSNQLLINYKESENTFELLKLIPFNSELKIKHSSHNRVN